MRKIGIVIPTYNRFEMTINSFAQVLYDDRVEEVVICDDASTDNSFWQLQKYFKDEPKVKLVRNAKNLDCYFNKHRAMENAESEWCILLDSDNIIYPAYLDVLYSIPEWDKAIAYQPSFSRPHFDFRKYEGWMLTKDNVEDFIDTNLTTALNAMNFFINRDEYLKVWDGSVDPVTSDSIFFAYTWLMAGNNYLITPNLEYIHHISESNDGHYQQNYKRTGNFHQELLEKFKQLI